MCDYSLHTVASRPAKAADRLVLTEFRGSLTRGFASSDDSTTAVCLLPGTEIEFERDVCVRGFIFHKKVRDRMARFRKLHVEDPHRHHDALEFSNGTVVLITHVLPGQKARVLQLPADPARLREKREPALEAAAETVAEVYLSK
jgi:hypothetical protein